MIKFSWIYVYYQCRVVLQSSYGLCRDHCMQSWCDRQSALSIFVGGIYSSGFITLPYNPLVAMSFYLIKKINLTDFLLFLTIETVAALIATFVYFKFFMKKK